MGPETDAFTMLNDKKYSNHLPYTAVTASVKVRGGHNTTLVSTSTSNKLTMADPLCFGNLIAI